MSTEVMPDLAGSPAAGAPSRIPVGAGPAFSFGPPVVVLCSARSGSTLLRFILDAHPDLGCPPETNLPSLCAQLATVWSMIVGAPLWDILGSADAWRAVLGGDLNLGVALRKQDLRYLDTGADWMAGATESRVDMFTDFLSL